VKLIIGGRQTGKTTELINWWKELPAYRAIIVAGKQRADWILADIALDDEPLANYAAKRIFSASNVPRDLLGWDIREIAVDEIDTVLGMLIGSTASLTVGTITPTDTKVLLPESATPGYL
jgi:hypothetical protein